MSFGKEVDVKIVEERAESGHPSALEAAREEMEERISESMVAEYELNGNVEFDGSRYRATLIRVRE